MPRGAPAAPDEAATKARVLDAAMRCFAQMGIAKTSLSDVARVAELSRGTVYRHFGDRQGLIDAVVAAGTQRYFANAAQAMSKKPTLAKQLGAYAEVVVREALERKSYSRIMEGDTSLMKLLVADSEESFLRSIEFLVPYVREAKGRGEVARAVPVTEAAEWLARVLMTITTTPTSSSFDVSDPRSVSRFVERYAVAGLLGKQ